MIRAMVYKITMITILISCLLFGISLFFEEWFKGLLTILLSMATSLISFYLIVYSTKDMNKIISNSYTYYIFRLIINGLALVVGLYFKLNLVLLILGLFSHKIAVMIYGIVLKGGQRWM